jgi:hypothetical protein
MRKLIGLAGAILWIAGHCSSAQADVIRNFRVGLWFAGAYSFDGTRRFSHCAGLAPYESGVNILFSINRNYQWSVGFVSPRFNVRPQENIILALSIDGEPPSRVTAYAVSNNHLVVELAPNAALFAKFKQGNTLRLIANDASHTFNLTGTSRLLPALLECVQNALNPTPMQTPPVAKPTQPPAPVEDYRAEATAIVANLLSQAGIAGFQILPAGRDELGHKADVSWTAGSLNGALLVLQDKSLESPADAAPVLIAMGAKACKGAFMSGSLPEEAHGTQARVFTSCRSDKSVRTVYYLTMRRGRGGYYVFATASDGSEEPAKEADTNIRTVVFNVLPKQRSPQH